MDKTNLVKKFCLIALVALVTAAPLGSAFADARGGHEYRGGRNYRPRHETVVVRGYRYNYHDGRWYRPSWFGINFRLFFPPIGATVTYIPDRCRTIVVGGISYYEYDNVYYRRSPYGYLVVSRPASSVDRETVTINVPGSGGKIIAVTLVRSSDGFIGPEGEVYPYLPTAEQLRARYGR